MKHEFHDKVALATGTNKGVGKGIALQLGRHGATVAVNYNSDAAGAEAIAREIRAMGVPAIVVQANVSVAADVEAMFATAMKAFGRLDIPVNNAGVQTWKALLELSEAEWGHVLDTNL